MRSLVAGVVAVPWVVWAVVRTFGVELPYPFVAVVAFTPYAALSSWVPVAVGVPARVVRDRLADHEAAAARRAALADIARKTRLASESS